MDFLLQVSPGDKLVGRVVLTKRETEVAGTLHGVSLAEENYTVVVFATDERYWAPGNRRNAAVAPDDRGRFSVKNLPPGSYRIAVLQDYDAAAGLYPELLRPLTGTSAVLISLADGQRLVQDLHVK
jgi:hypothetical protein